MGRLVKQILLAALFVVFAAVRVRFTAMTWDLVTAPQNVPRFPAQVHAETLAIFAATPALIAAGVHDGDVLLAEDGQPVRSFIDSARFFFRHKPGEKIVLTLRRGGGPPFDVTFVIPPREAATWVDTLIAIFLNIVTPWSCILLGFLIAFRRPGDPVALVVLALLLSMSQLAQAESGPRFGWEPLFTWPSLLLDNIAHHALAVVWFWFALLFPDPKSRHKLLPWVGWVIALPLLVQGFLVSITSTAFLHRAGALVWLFHWVNIPDWLENSADLVLFGLGFANIIYKLKREEQPAVRRRLQWMLLGLTLGLVPVLALFTICGLLGRDLNQTPAYILFPVIITPFLIPLTLAYAVLVTRIFDVGVFVRQGLLASKSVSILRYVLAAALVYAGVKTESRKDISNFTRYGTIAVCAAGVFTIRRTSEWARGWVDRQFFQEAVNTEHLLIELSGEVRRIANPEVLMRTVTERVANALHVSRVVALVPRNAGYEPAYATGAAGGGGTALAWEDPVIGRLKDQHEPIQRSGQLLLPIASGADLFGILSLGPKRSEEPYSGLDIRLLESVASQTALALENGRLTATVAEEAVQRERITSELEIARQVQERLFPRRAPPVPRLELAGRCVPAQTVGGDYFDFLESASGGVGLAIGDVAGKGVPAALLMAGLQASLRGLMLAGMSEPAELLGKLNVLIYDATPLNRFATFFYGLYDADTRRLRYSSAGHNPALLYRSALDQALWLKTPGIGLGLKRTSVYQQAEIYLEPGDCLVLYTDGITEARNRVDEEFGEDRLLAALRGCAQGSAGQILQTLLANTAAFVDGAPQFDDLTLIVAHAT